MNDYSTENATRELLPPSDDTTLTDVPTPEIDVAIIEHEAERIESDHVFTPPEPGPGDAPEGEYGEQDVTMDGDEITDRWERPGQGYAPAFK